ncbi:hypothetical protein RRG08_039769 [Elysia crispata]|uniref:Uncharacterized protein n=1 Tax=Elysia crispata TaxID=231223 RepID=A0AAE0ZTN3_9GAST|nr:hypothetical protein RRG08_039769 [Elysia crispata]
MVGGKFVTQMAGVEMYDRRNLPRQGLPLEAPGFRPAVFRFGTRRAHASSSLSYPPCYFSCDERDRRTGLVATCGIF